MTPSPPRQAPLRSRLLAECLGSGLLVTVVVGSGAMAERLSPGDTGLQLLENSVATTLGLAVLILVLGPVSGAHFNPVVSLVDWLAGRRQRSGLTGAEVGWYALAQTGGGVCGALLANVMFAVSPGMSATDRSDVRLLVGEVVATAGLVLVVLALARTGQARLAAPAVGAYIGAAYWFTSSTSFANPAVTVGRAFTDSFAGIAPASVPGFLVAQVVGGLVGLALVQALYREGGSAADDVVVPHTAQEGLS